jgi:hypothetical protein
MVIHNMSKQGIVQGCLRDKLHLFVIDSVLFILIVDSAKNPGIEAHIAEQLDLSQTVSESVNLPGSTWHVLFSESSHNPQVTLGHIVNYVFVVTGGLVVHRNPPSHELKLLVLY